MTQQSKRFKEIEALYEPDKQYSLKEAAEILKKCPPTKFDQSVEFSLRMGVDPKKSDQQVRGTISMPHGTGKNITLVVIAKGEKAKEALEAGADFAGAEELVEKIKGGWLDFNALVVTPDMMREVGKLGKILGPRGLMPTPKAGTVTMDVVKAVKELKAGKIEFKVDKSGVINCIVGKVSFSIENIVENAEALVQAIARAKPATAKGVYMKSLALSSTMGPGLHVNMQSLPNS